MSNLSLPKMTFVTLNAMLSNAEEAGRQSQLKIAYETTIERGAGIVVRHHGNPIAAIGRDFFTLGNGGWNSVTTANRLNHILRDNQTILPTDPTATDRLWYSAACRQGSLAIWGRPVEGPARLLQSLDSGVAHFSRTSSDAHFVLHA